MILNVGAIARLPTPGCEPVFELFFLSKPHDVVCNFEINALYNQKPFCCLRQRFTLGLTCRKKSQL